MALREGVLLAVKGGLVELTAEVAGTAGLAAEDFAREVRDRVFEHQYQIMTDPAILDPDSVSVASCVVSRDPLPGPFHDALASLGFAPAESEGGGQEEHSIFQRLVASRARRSKLDKWRAPYLRARDVSPRLAALEAELLEQMPEGDLGEIAEEAAGALVRGFAEHLRARLGFGVDGLRAMESRLIEERAQAKGRLVLQPAFVRAMAAFTGESARAEAPDSAWAGDEDEPLNIQASGGLVVRTDPELRVVQLVAQGRKAALSEYVERCLSQSLTAAGQA